MVQLCWAVVVEAASALGIPSVCFAEILKAMSHDGALPPSAAFEGCQKLKRGFVDVGDVVDSAGYFEQSSAA